MGSKYLMDEHIKEILIKSLKLLISEQNINKSKKIKILDLGCGDKPYKKLIEDYLKEFKIEYIGVDYYNPSADLKLDLNTDRLPFKDEYFDFILCTEVLEHLYNPFNCLNEMKRLVKKRGLILITTPFMFPVHDKKNDYFRYTENFYFHYFNKKENFDIVYIKKSNKYLASFLLFVEIYFPYIPKKIITFLNKLSNFLFKDRFLNEAHYLNIGCIIKKTKR